MAERDENVYKAKLAEQAERYDGKCVVDIVPCVYKYVWFESPTITQKPLKLFQRFHSILLTDRIFAVKFTFTFYDNIYFIRLSKSTILNVNDFMAALDYVIRYTLLLVHRFSDSSISCTYHRFPRNLLNFFYLLFRISGGIAFPHIGFSWLVILRRAAIETHVEISTFDGCLDNYIFYVLDLILLNIYQVLIIENFREACSYIRYNFPISMK